MSQRPTRRALPSEREAVRLAYVIRPTGAALRIQVGKYSVAGKKIPLGYCIASLSQL